MTLPSPFEWRPECVHRSSGKLIDTMSLASAVIQRIKPYEDQSKREIIDFYRCEVLQDHAVFCTYCQSCRCFLDAFETRRMACFLSESGRLDRRQGACLHPSRSDDQNTMSQWHSSWRQRGNSRRIQRLGDANWTNASCCWFFANLKMSKARNIFLHPEHMMKHHETPRFFYVKVAWLPRFRLSLMKLPLMSGTTSHVQSTIFWQKSMAKACEDHITTLWILWQVTLGICSPILAVLSHGDRSELNPRTSSTKHSAFHTITKLFQGFDRISQANQI